MRKDIQQFVKVLDFWNSTLQRDELQTREIINQIDYKAKEIVDLVGPRRSGKSSILKLIIRHLNLKENFLFLNFEDPFFIENNQAEIIEEAIEVFEAYFHPKIRYLFFDEIQQIHQWERAVRKLRDSGRYKIFITGSSSKLLSGEISSLLTGRHLSYPVFTLSFREFLEFRGITLTTKKDIILKEQTLRKEFQTYLGIGGFPEVVISQNMELLKYYFFDILQKDIVMRYEVREKEILEKIAVYLLSNASKIISTESLKNTFGISYALVSSYLGYLKESLLVFELPQFSYSLKKQHKTLKKFYAVDTGLSQAVSFRFTEDNGRILENVVFLHLKRKKDEFYYYRTKNNQEVDFLIKNKKEPNQLIQVTWSFSEDETKTRETKALFDAMQELKIKESFILTNAEEETIRKDGLKIFVKPVYKWLLEERL